MKKILILAFVIITAFSLQSCDEFLDINDNPNSATSVGPQLLLPAGIVRSASLTVSFNTYGGQLNGYIANAGGFSGFGALLTYDFTPGYLSQWENVYPNLMDYKIILNAAAEAENLQYFKAVAEIMSVFEYQRLVDMHGDVPYTEGLQGNGNISPVYDKADDIYKDLIKRLNESIALIKSKPTFQVSLGSSSDPLFKGDLDKWVQFANTLKLRILLRISNSSLSSFAQGELASIENNFLKDDALVNPGYAADRSSPTWSTWGYSSAGALANNSRVPSYFTFGYYDGGKLRDQNRGAAIYNDFGNTSRPTPLNQLGVEQGNPPVRPNYSPWYSGIRNSASDITNAVGVVKGFAQGQPIMLLAESYFLQAEAQLKGYLPGDYAASFDNGIKSSYRYLVKDVNGAVTAAGSSVNGIPVVSVDAFLTNYKTTENPFSYLVNIDLASSDEERLEAIITQKYIAFNMIDGGEAWNEFRRTGYPKTTPRADKYNDMASTTSNATTANRLPTTLLYPQSEFSYNADHVRVLNHFGDKIFWAK